jgi:hypothetical protein
MEMGRAVIDVQLECLGRRHPKAPQDSQSDRISEYSRSYSGPAVKRWALEAIVIVRGCPRHAITRVIRGTQAALARCRLRSNKRPRIGRPLAVVGQFRKSLMTKEPLHPPGQSRQLGWREELGERRGRLCRGELL